MEELGLRAQITISTGFTEVRIIAPVGAQPGTSRPRPEAVMNQPCTEGVWHGDDGAQKIGTELEQRWDIPRRARCSLTIRHGRAPVS